MPVYASQAVCPASSQVYRSPLSVCAVPRLQGPFNKEFRELLMSRDFYGDCIKLHVPVTQDIQVGIAAAAATLNVIQLLGCLVSLCNE